MKKIIILLSLSVVLFFPSSCEDYLNKPIEGKVPLDEVNYTDQTIMYQPVAGLLAFARENLIRWSDGCVERFRSDLIVKGGSIGDQPAMELILEKYQYDNSIWFITQPWNNCYQLIKRCNDALAELDKFREHCIGEAMALNDQYKSEIRFIRALAYLKVTRLYGDVCWFDRDIPSIDLRRSPREDVYAWLIGELKDLRQYLPKLHPNALMRKGAITYWAANMTLTKAAADIHDYKTMEEASGEIVNSGLFQLYPDFYECFTVNGELSQENIFELQFMFNDIDGNATNIDQWYVYAGIPGVIINKVPVNGAITIGGGWGFHMPSQKLIDLLEKRHDDIRKRRYIIEPGTVSPKGDIIPEISKNYKELYDYYTSQNLPNGVALVFGCKWFMESVDRHSQYMGYGGMNNVRIYRYADALLLYAEALVHNHGKGAGDKYLNMVRARVGLEPIFGAGIDEIIEERGLELHAEWGGDRFYDLVRTGKTDELGSNFTKGEDEFFPVPQEQIDLHLGLAEESVPGLFPTTFGAN